MIYYFACTDDVPDYECNEILSQAVDEVDLHHNRVPHAQSCPRDGLQQ